jgi:hypothetical protein
MALGRIRIHNMTSTGPKTSANRLCPKCGDPTSYKLRNREKLLSDIVLGTQALALVTEKVDIRQIVVRFLFGNTELKRFQGLGPALEAICKDEIEDKQYRWDKATRALIELP